MKKHMRIANDLTKMNGLKLKIIDIREAYNINLLEGYVIYPNRVRDRLFSSWLNQYYRIIGKQDIKIVQISLLGERLPEKLAILHKSEKNKVEPIKKRQVETESNFITELTNKYFTNWVYCMTTYVSDIE